MIILLTIAEALAEDGEVGFTLAEIWEHSGWLARAVIVNLLAMLLGTILIFFERLIAFRSATNQSRQLAAKIVPFLNDNDVAAARKLADSEEFKNAYLGGMLKGGLAELELREDHYGVLNAKMAVEKAVGQEISKLRRGMPILATVGSTAPFVGLFGTTFGVINAFQGMASSGAGLSAISAGISEALITTGVGIGVAVVGVWAFNYFNNRVDKVNEELASSEVDFLVWAEKLTQDPPTAEAAK